MNSWHAILRCSLVCSLMLCAACAAKEPGGLAGNTPCEKWSSLSRIVGCEVTKASDAGCNIAPGECSAEANAWIECAARDQAQCQCNSDDNTLNCEGSFKVDEGPAACIAEYRAFGECAKL
jgi:hypothetical protein